MPGPPSSLVTLAVTALLFAAPAAQAQVFWPDDCSRAVGWAGGATVSQRDWDFTTPGRVATTGSPVISQWCNQAVSDIVTSWFGVDVMPLYMHSYRRLADRAPLLVMLDMGGTLQLNRRQHIGLHITTNAVALGAGARWEWIWSRGDDAHRHGLDTRLNVLWGTEPDVQMVMLYTFRSREIDW